MEHTPESEDSTLLVSPLEDAAQKALLESGLPATDYNAAIVAEVATAAGETGLVEASKVADRMTDEYRANAVLQGIARAALHDPSALDRATRRDLFLMIASGHTGKKYRKIRLEKARRAAAAVEISARRSSRGNNQTLDS